LGRKGRLGGGGDDGNIKGSTREIRGIRRQGNRLSTLIRAIKRRKMGREAARVVRGGPGREDVLKI